MFYISLQVTCFIPPNICPLNISVYGEIVQYLCVTALSETADTES